jgi:hypothetical protein
MFACFSHFRDRRTFTMRYACTPSSGPELATHARASACRLQQQRAADLAADFDPSMFAPLPYDERYSPIGGKLARLSVRRDGSANNKSLWVPMKNGGLSTDKSKSTQRLARGTSQAFNRECSPA